jgi:citrate synthase
VAAGILGAGPVILGAAESCGVVLVEAQRRVSGGKAAGVAAIEIARETKASGGRLPGFGHPVHHPLDPRAERILELADAHNVSAAHVTLARSFREAAAEVWGKKLPMNVSMPIAAVLLDLDFPAEMIKAIPILARTAGLLAHLAEERERPIGFLMASHAEAAIAYDGDAKPDGT